MSDIAIVGTGQLARMMVQAVNAAGHRFSFLKDPGENTSCIDGMGEIVERNKTDSAESIFNQLGQPDVITVEKEFVDCELLEALTAYTQVHPHPEFLRIAKNRSLEKNFLADSGIPVVPFAVVQGATEINAGVNQVGYPVVIKSTTQGYDGQNQWVINNQEELDAFLLTGATELELIIEKKIDFDCELSIIACRNPRGDMAFYPLALNTHLKGILLTSIVPFTDCPAHIAEDAKNIARKILTEQNYVGVLSIEFFLWQGQLFVNEMAPRVHNSGHWSMDGAKTSQFENHIRAILNHDLGSTDITHPTAMINLLGVEPVVSLISKPNLHLHAYNKSVRPRRKVGHINMTFTDTVDMKQVNQLVDVIYPESI